MIAPARPAVPPLLSGRLLGFDPRWLVRHAEPCDRPAVALPTLRYIGGAAPTAETPIPCRTDTARMGFAPREYRSLRRRLDRWELDHLRQHAADLAEQLEAERRARERADDAAEFWREQALNVDLREGERLGLAVDGSLHVVPASLERSPA